MAEPQISVSRETLRAELAELQLSLSGALAQLELRLIDRLADKAELRALEAQLTALDRLAILRDDPLVGKIGSTAEHVDELTASRNRFAGGLAVVASIAFVSFARVWLGVG